MIGIALESQKELIQNRKLVKYFSNNCTEGDS